MGKEAGVVAKQLQNHDTKMLSSSDWGQKVPQHLLIARLGGLNTPRAVKIDQQLSFLRRHFPLRGQKAAKLANRVDAMKFTSNTKRL